MPDYSDGELEKNDQQNNGARNQDDDDRSVAGGGSEDDEDVFIQAAAISGDMQADGQPGKYQVVDEASAPGVKLKQFFDRSKF